ncbi:MAG TPA: carboxypeptidase-like regulatory domain-containing protein, partial [Blastocatellia bacterium]|nr:carboxypeptidase-like regulatory domain-containing protein [Blastocatellia bacterium]
MKRLGSTILIIAVALAFNMRASSQSLRIQGVVLDQNGGAVSRADVTLISNGAVGTESLATATDAEGRFAIDTAGLPATLTVHAPGFAPYSRT